MATDVLSAVGDGAGEVREEAVKAVRQRMRRRDLLALLAWTGCADYLVFRTLGYSGPGLFFALAPVILFLGIRKSATGAAVFWMTIVWLAAFRLVWQGSTLGTTAACAGLVALAMAAKGWAPNVLDGVLVSICGAFDGASWIARHRLPAWGGRKESHSKTEAAHAALMLPVLAASVFGAIFVLANPDLVNAVTEQLRALGDWIWTWFGNMSFWEIPFCLLALCVGAGLLMPVLRRVGPAQENLVRVEVSAHALLYAAYRNTLLTLIVLYGAYLGFEFATLWTRRFPIGFYYAGYAHQGAAWLTLALVLATVSLSLIFRGPMLADPRIGRLRVLAWAWSALNLLLAVSVYNRLAIYVGYNGMTRMRMVGFFGITVVVLGFMLVLYKIARGRGFWWLVRSQLMALMMTILVYGLFPVDFLAHWYNSQRIADGYLPPSVMLAVKVSGDEGLISMINLADEADDRIIRDGVRALLAERQLQIEKMSRKPWHWTKFQGSTEVLYRRLKENEGYWRGYLLDSPKRQLTLERFRQYTMQWY